VPSGPAFAHGTDPRIRTVLDSVEPEIPGVTIQVAASVSAEVVAENTTPTDLTVIAETGEPFLRIGPGGVFANQASPSWYLSNSPFGEAAVPAEATPDATPRWTLVSVEPSWSWFDHRLHPRPRGRPRRVPSDRKPLRLATWTVPFDYGGTPVVAEGRVVYAPARGAITARLRGSARPLDDVVVQLSPGRVPALLVANTGSEPVIVRGPQGEPFLRIGPGGTEVNRHSSLWIDNARARDQDVTASAAVADPLAEPDWMVLSDAPTISWLEFRGNYAPGNPPPRVVRSGERAVLHRWSVPIEQGDRTARIRGETFWRPAGN
jgi:hypothetical protein